MHAALRRRGVASVPPAHFLQVTAFPGTEKELVCAARRSPNWLHRWDGNLFDVPIPNLPIKIKDRPDRLFVYKPGFLWLLFRRRRSDVRCVGRWARRTLQLEWGNVFKLRPPRYPVGAPTVLTYWCGLDLRRV
jgi:hypothetical protein